MTNVVKTVGTKVSDGRYVLKGAAEIREAMANAGVAHLVVYPFGMRHVVRVGPEVLEHLGDKAVGETYVYPNSASPYGNVYLGRVPTSSELDRLDRV